MELKSIPSLIRWTGSKRSQALEIAKYAPAYTRYVEPFVGSGAVCYLLGRPGSIISDIYEPLISLWKMVRDEPGALIADYTEQWYALQADFPNYYYEVRDRYNAQSNPMDLNFLTRTCVNGIIRFNRKGEFNASIHLSRKGMEPARFSKVVYLWVPIVQDIRMECQDYRTTLDGVGVGDFVYLDPPYAGNGTTRYICSVEPDSLFQTLDDLNRRGVKWALSYDGVREATDLRYDVPTHLYERQLLLAAKNSALSQVLLNRVESVRESLYLNY